MSHCSDSLTFGHLLGGVRARGETLRDNLKREVQLGINEAVTITREVADALQYAHEQGAALSPDSHSDEQYKPEVL